MFFCPICIDVVRIIEEEVEGEPVVCIVVVVEFDFCCTVCTFVGSVKDDAQFDAEVNKVFTAFADCKVQAKVKFDVSF